MQKQLLTIGPARLYSAHLLWVSDRLAVAMVSVNGHTRSVRLRTMSPMIPNFARIFSATEPQISFEFFPPKREEDMPATCALMRRLAEFNPAFMTVTYGAGGGTRHLTQGLVSYIARELQVPAVAHLTCVGHTKEDIDGILAALSAAEVHMVLALRGDPPKGQPEYDFKSDAFSCARDLARYIKSKGSFSIAVAGYPEKHKDAADLASDIQYLKEKLNAGGEVVLTQLFFDAECYFEFVRAARAGGVTAPIVPGIIPISNVAQIERFTSMCGASIPASLKGALEGIRNDPQAVHSFGVSYAVDLCRQLLAAGAPGLHFYTLNRSSQVEEILNRLELGKNASRSLAAAESCASN